jgi:cytidyltransferase-like protein
MADESYIALSGGFDPVTIGHVRMFRDAARLGKTIVLLNSDAWLLRKKSYVFMPFEQRKEILEAMQDVWLVLPAMDNDDSVCQSVLDLKDTISYFGNGGDRAAYNTPEKDICTKNGIQVIYGLGGGKIASSSELVKHVQKG